MKARKIILPITALFATGVVTYKLLLTDEARVALSDTFLKTRDTLMYLQEQKASSDNETNSNNDIYKTQEMVTQEWYRIGY